MMKSDFLWTELYRPKTIEDTILSPEYKKMFQKFVDQGNIPNLILSGTAGVGKTTVAKAMLEQLGCDYIVINGSLNAGIDVLRHDIQQFASSVSMLGGRKYVILDEADYLSADKVQPALRNFIEEYSKNCGFIMTCNYKHRIIEPLHSRCTVIDFKIKKEDLPSLAGQFHKRAMQILKTENVEADPAAVAALIKTHLPDWRRVLNELQRYSASGKIDSGILTSLDPRAFKELTGFLKNKQFGDARRWLVANADTDTATLFRALYDNCSQYVEPASVPAMVMVLAKYQYQAAFVADHEINLAAALVELMVECEFK
jgi:DNA polymerase III delta prime subunit